MNLSDHSIYCCGQGSLRSNGVAQNAVLGYRLKNDSTLSVHFQDKPFNIPVIQVYVPTTDAEEGEVDHFYEDLSDILKLTPKKKMSLSSYGTVT